MNQWFHQIKQLDDSIHQNSHVRTIMPELRLAFIVDFFQPIRYASLHAFEKNENIFRDDGWPTMNALLFNVQHSLHLIQRFTKMLRIKCNDGHCFQCDFLLIFRNIHFYNQQTIIISNMGKCSTLIFLSAACATWVYSLQLFLFSGFICGTKLDGAFSQFIWFKMWLLMIFQTAFEL